MEDIRNIIKKKIYLYIVAHDLGSDNVTEDDFDPEKLLIEAHKTLLKKSKSSMLQQTITKEKQLKYMRYLTYLMRELNTLIMSNSVSDNDRYLLHNTLVVAKGLINQLSMSDIGSSKQLFNDCLVNYQSLNDSFNNIRQK